MNSPAKPYRPAVRGLVFGLTALGLRAASIATTTLAVADKPLLSSNAAMEALPVMNLAATILALVGVSYAAIAAHRREWSVALVIAWVSSIAAALLDVGPFVYATF